MVWVRDEQSGSRKGLVEVRDEWSGSKGYGGGGTQAIGLELTWLVGEEQLGSKGCGWV